MGTSDRFGVWPCFIRKNGEEEHMYERDSIDAESFRSSSLGFLVIMIDN